MRIRRYVAQWTTLVAMIVLVAFAPQVPAQEAPQNAAMISSPRLKPGSWWTFQTWDRNQDAILDTWVLTREEGEKLIVHSEGREAVYDREWGLVQETILEADAVWILYSPPLSLLSFPLQEGGAWQRSIAASSHISIQNGYSIVATKRTISAKALHWEKVRVPAGTFRAIRLEVQVDSAKATCWYAVEPQNFVRCISSDNPRYDFDLVRFNLVK